MRLIFTWKCNQPCLVCVAVQIVWQCVLTCFNFVRQFDDQLKTCVADCSISLKIGLEESVMYVPNLLNSANYIKICF